MSENELSSRDTHPAATISNGQTLTLKNRSNGKPYLVGANQRITLKFALNKNATMRVHLRDTVNNQPIGDYWQGLTGGLSLSRTSPSNGDTLFEVKIQNLSSDPVTVLWATVTF